MQTAEDNEKLINFEQSHDTNVLRKQITCL